ncbi:MAG: exosome complex RNA-binding protein Csl4 [Candidatus Heimdallarchaeota archaeon]|nr:MAG: exosome complex RNA-binding protein Csl4 [Candidatus Heimdallarchaeota archaeon]
MNNNKKSDADYDWVLPGDKIAVIEEFLPDETCYEQDGSIYSRIVGRVMTDSKKHKISVVPKHPLRSIKSGDIGLGRVEYMKKQIASVDIYHLNKKNISIPISAVLHISEASRRFVKNMYEVTRPGDWLRFRIIRAMKPVYISLIGDGLGVIISYCIQCGYELEYKRRNLLECPNCETTQSRITSKYFGKPLIRNLRPSRNETR